MKQPGLLRGIQLIINGTCHRYEELVARVLSRNTSLARYKSRNDHQNEIHYGSETFGFVCILFGYFHAHPPATKF